MSKVEWYEQSGLCDDEPPAARFLKKAEQKLLSDAHASVGILRERNAPTVSMSKDTAGAFGYGGGHFLEKWHQNFTV